MTAAFLCGGAGSGCSQKKQESFFPLTLGSSWTYQGKAGTQPLTMTATVSSVKQDGDNSTAVLLWSQDGQTFKEETYLAGPTGITRSKSGVYGSSVLNPPIVVIPYPLTVGKKWAWKGDISTVNVPSVPATSEGWVAEREQVKTSAGSFNAFRVDVSFTMTIAGNKITSPSTYWFAPGVGLVKQMATSPQPGGSQIPIEASLIKYTIK
jgi:hypothetical protein